SRRSRCLRRGRPENAPHPRRARRARPDRVQFQAVAVRRAGPGRGSDRPPSRYIRWMRLLTAIVLAAVFALRPAAQVIDAAPRITQEEFKKLRAAGNVIIVDTRNPDA